MLAFTELSELSTLDEELERFSDEVLRPESAPSRLDEELLRLMLDVWLVEMLALTELSELSTLEDEFESWFELVLMTERRLSTLDEELERLRLEV